MVNPTPRHRIGRRVGARQVGGFDHPRDARDPNDARRQGVEHAVGLDSQRGQAAVVAQEQHAGLEFQPLARSRSAPRARQAVEVPIDRGDHRVEPDAIRGSADSRPGPFRV